MSAQTPQAYSALILPNFKTTSRNIARDFRKEHRDVLRRIRTLIEDAGEWGMRNFTQTPYVDAQNGQTYEMYEMTRDGFAMLVMGFTGKSAFEWKLTYLEAFNDMEEALKDRPANPYPFDPEELMHQTRDQLERFRAVTEEMNRFHQEAVSTFSKAHHNYAFRPRPEAGTTLVRAHVRKIGRK